MKRRKYALWIILMAVTWNVFGAEDDFKLNQLGYYPRSTKIAVVEGTKDTVFDVVKITGEKVFSGKLSNTKVWSTAKDTVKQADFSALTEDGIYRIKVADRGSSYPFRISSNVLRAAAFASLKCFYFQRCSMELDSQYAGIYSRPAGHPDTACFYHSSSGISDATLTGRSPGGWYDAGDYGKYVVNAGITVGTLLSFYENFSDYFGDSSLKIPESGNKISDLLDEVRYELNWLKTMQDTDGGVFFKLTTLQFSGMVMPKRDLEDRFFIGKSTSSALDFAAVMAMAGRIYEEIDSSYARNCIDIAEKAWIWAKDHPQVYFSNPADVGTGGYGDSNLSDEFIWAASELFISTNKEEYKTFLTDKNLLYTGAPGWQNVKNLAPLSLATVVNNLDENRVDSIKKSIVSFADKSIAEMDTQAYRLPKFSFYWGSNSVIANTALALVYAFKVTNDTTYMKKAAEITDYLFGKNATSYSFMTGYGAKTPMFPHHRPSVADKIAPPVPGFLVGGANGTPNTYTDSEESYNTNEVAINWSSPFTALLAAIDKVLGNGTNAAAGPYVITTIVQGDGDIVVTPLKALYEKGDVVTVKAVSRNGSSLKTWSGAISGSMDSVQIIVDKDIRIVAEFGVFNQQITNGDFSDSLTGWSKLTLSNGAVATADVVNGELKIAITNGGTVTYSIQLVQSKLELVNGKKYELKFDARADSARSIIFDVTTGASPYPSLMGASKDTTEITTEMKTYSYIFTMNEATITNGRLVIFAGRSDKSIYLDNIRLKVYDPSGIHDIATGKNLNYHGIQIRKNPAGNIAGFYLVKPANASMKLYDVQGRLILNISNKLRTMHAGYNEILFGGYLVPGTYVIRYCDGVVYLNKKYNFLK